MLKIAEKLDSQTGTIVEVCINRKPTPFLRPINWILGESDGKICKKSLQLVLV